MLSVAATVCGYWWDKAVEIADIILKPLRCQFAEGLYVWHLNRKSAKVENRLTPATHCATMLWSIMPRDVWAVAGWCSPEATGLAVAFRLLEMLNGPDDVEKIRRAMRFID